ncbi:Mov34/MPN/PAD-1 family protein [Brevibacillus sp. NPDC003359]|uniref:Mov34/MPN/PAD-1 family protein n=1 Tax=unclassified Brevibacillus TaxID=2684853 RepID=UPI0036C82268
MIQELLFALPDGRRVLIRSVVVERLMKYQQVEPKDKEAGGILIGRILLEDGNFIIDDASEPLSSDIRLRNRFIRNTDGHQDYFNTSWLENDGHCFYLGEWHTHPEAHPIPSCVDTRDWNRIMRLNHESDSLFFVIVGTQSVHVWQGNRVNLKIVKLMIVEEKHV